MRRLAAYTLLCCCILLPLTASQEATDGPSWAPTGKLNQFRGYVTPRPLPPNAEFVYSSIWAAWSAWSFCNNGVKIRVRACNTVRGFSCLGKNQEFMPCDTDAMATSSRNLARLPSDYDVVDPYEADRREAMRQLYPDDFAAATEPAVTQTTRPNPNFHKIPKPDEQQQFHRHRVHAAPKTKTREPIILNRAEGDFSTERRRQIPERAPKVRLAEVADEEHRPQSFEKQHSREELGRKPIDNAELSVDDISREHHLSAEQVQIHRQELDAALNTLKNDESPSLQLRDEGFSGDHRLSALDVRPPPKTDVLDITKRIGSAEITDEKPEKFDEELDADGHQDITHSDFAKTAELKTADVAVIGVPSTTTAEPETAAEVLEDDDHFEQFGTRPEIVQPKLNNVIDEEPTPDVVTPSSPEVPEEVHEEITVAETTTTTTTEPSTITIPLATPELVTELVTEAFTEAPTTFEEFSTTVFPPPAIVDISTAVNRHRPVAGNAEFKSFGISKVIPKHSSKQKKNRGFGITGFLLQKSERKRFVHDGSVTKKSGYMPPKKFVHKAAPMKTAFLAKPATTAAPDISPDTLHALDWMLRNISKIAEEGDAAFVRALNFNSQETDNQMTRASKKTGFTREHTMKKLKKTKKFRKTKLRKGLSKQRMLSKAKGTAIHSGEFKFKVSKTTFPKFRSRSTSASRARSFGVRTVSDDKAFYQVTGVTTDQQKTANPSKLLEEIANLEAMMNSVERKVEQVVAKQPGIPESSPLERSDEFTDSAGPAEEIEHTPSPAAMDLSLVPLEKGFVPGASQTLEEFHQQPMHLLTEKLELTGETRWTEWSEWADCFCGKQVRTRRCLYTGVMSQGCQGDSYESRSCVGGSCPISVPSTSAYPIQITSSSPSPDDIHRQFRPLKLNTAISLS